MKNISNLTLSTSPQPNPARKPRCFASLALRQRSLYGRTRRCFTGKELDSETGLYYYGARYLDPKTSRWISGDPAVGEYVPQAEVKGRKLPNGGVYNTVSLHVYNYSNNNPVKYVDPDGETPQSYKLSEGNYRFYASASTLDGAVSAAFRNVFPIPFAGGIVEDFINSKFNFKNINTESTYSTLANAASKLTDGVSSFSKIAKIAGKTSDAIKIAGNIAGIISTALTVIDVGVELSKTNSVGMDQMISNILGNELHASSHEGVATLYTYAVSEMKKLKNEGAFSYTTDKSGRITSYSYKPSDFDNLRQELRILKKAMEE